MAIAAPGVLLAGEPAFTLVARQYHERVFEFDGAAFLHGNLVAPFVWSLVIACAFGVVVVAAVGVVGLLKSGDWQLIVRSRLALPAVVATGFFVRVITLLTVAPERTDGGDPLFYHTTANVLARGRGFPEPLNWIAYGIHRPSAFHGPLYPVVLSISSRFGGTSYFDHKMMSIVIGTGLVLAVGVLAKRLGGTAVGLVAAAFAAIYPNLWLIDSLLYPEGLMALLVTITMIVAYRWRDRPRLATAALFGAVIALTALARGEGILLLPLLALPWIMFTKSLARRARLRHLVVTALACAAVLAPWMIRNATTFEKFVPLSTNGNEVMVYANCATAYNGPFVGYWDYQCQQTVREAKGDPPGDESQTALYWRSLGLRLRTRPRRRTATRRHPASPSPMGAVPSAAERDAGRHRGPQPRRRHDGAADVLRPGGAVDRRRRLDAPSADPVVAAGRAVPQCHHHRRVHVRHHAVPRPRRAGVVRARRSRVGTRIGGGSTLARQGLHRRCRC